MTNDIHCVWIYSQDWTVPADRMEPRFDTVGQVLVHLHKGTVTTDVGVHLINYAVIPFFIGRALLGLVGDAKARRRVPGMVDDAAGCVRDMLVGQESNPPSLKMCSGDSGRANKFMVLVFNAVTIEC